MPKKEEKGAGATSGGAAWRKLKPVIDDLNKIVKEYGKDEKTVNELKGLDAFDSAKRELNETLSEVKKSIDQIDEMKRNLSEGDRDVNTIKLSSDTRKKLKECSDKWNAMKKVLDKEIAKGAKSKVPPEKLEQRRNMLSVLGQELVSFNNRLSAVKEIKSSVELGVVAARRAERKEKKRRRGRRGRGGDDEPAPEDGTDGTADGENGEDFDGDAAPPSEQQLAFMDRKDAAYAEQDEMLDMLSKGMDDLKQMGLAINKELKVQDKILDAVDEQMDKTIEKVKTQNEKLQELIDANGGAARWCPIIICLVILLALAGYIFRIV